MGATIWKFGVFWLIFFDVPPHHFLNRFQIDFSIILGSFMPFCFLGFVTRSFWGCKCSRRSHGSIVFEVLAPCILMIFAWFSSYFHVIYRFVFGSIIDAILVRFWIYFWSLGGEKVTNMSSKIDAKIGIKKSRSQGCPTTKEILELVARMGVKEKVNLPPGGQEVRKKGRKEERK